MTVDTIFPEVMTPQEIFEHVSRFLLKQNKKSSSETELGKFQCAYRGNDNTACAAGCLLTDEEADQIRLRGLNNVSWDLLIEDKLIPSRLEPHSDMIQNLQAIHDLYEPSVWKIKLIELGRNHPGVDITYF